jgi:hypothetical protein
VGRGEHQRMAPAPGGARICVSWGAWSGFAGSSVASRKRGPEPGESSGGAGGWEPPRQLTAGVAWVPHPHPCAPKPTASSEPAFAFGMLLLLVAS